VANNYSQGLYVPKNPEKYVGDVTKIRYMSSWELELHKFFDNNTKILRWSSESIAIPYIKPTDGRIHKYYPDYWIEYVNRDGKIVREIIECKPRSQTRQPRKQRGTGKTSIYESLQFAVNSAKWAAAIEWCKQRGFEFRIVTEKSIFK
jgi:TnsA endonuclease N terminal